MKILSVNAGSSSFKFTAYEMPEEKVLISGYFEKIGLEDSFYNIKVNGEKIKKEIFIKNHEEAAKLVIEELINNHIVDSLDEIKGVGHRVVHGGDNYADSIIIDDEVIKTVKELSPLAPLHNPANLVGVDAMKKAISNAVHVAVFDTAFHQTMPKENYIYSVPFSWYRDYKVRKYGFHGTSHKYITSVMQEKLGKKDVNLIICHIGSGGSLSAVKDGKSINTTMGFGPNAGITMGTRSGDIDYALIPYMMKQTGKDITEIDTILNKQSGLFGISEKYSDCRDIEKAEAAGEESSALANNIYIQKIVNYIAEYYVQLEGKVDALVMTAGTGENGREFRERVIRKLACLGITIDVENNNEIAGYLDRKEGIISTSDSTVPVYVIPTDEEVMIARDTLQFID